MKYEVMIHAFRNATLRSYVDEQGNPVWVGKEVCGLLGIRFYRDALARLDSDEGCRVLIDTPGGPQSAAAVNEAGLYTLVLQSRKPWARAFRRWVTHEVLPAIRKYGKYELEEQRGIELLMRVVLCDSQESASPGLLIWSFNRP